ncbi:MAG: ABC transporter permease [Lachnospiraceae bacterium]|nr:ABC transporter permease [Lachnospiraceae bacterium]
MKSEKKNGTYFLSVLMTILGFLLAAFLNAAVPQKADVVFKPHEIFGITTDSNTAYRFVLVLLSLYYLILGIVSARSEEKKNKYIHATKFRFVMGLLLFLWDLLGTKLQALPQPFFPGPAGIMEAFVAESDYILENTLYSLRLYICGFFIGVVTGILTGILVGWFPKVRYWLSPIMNVLGVIPAVAWMPFALTIMPNPFSAAVFLIAVSVWGLVATLTATGVQSTPKTQFEAGRVLGGNERYLVFHVAIPHALPQIFTGITTSNGYAFTTLVMAEMMGQPGGLGYYINASKVWSAYYKVFAAIIVMAILFSVITHLIELLQKRVLRWQEGVVK